MLDDIKILHDAEAEHAAVHEHVGLDAEALHVIAKYHKSWRNFHRGPKGRYSEIFDVILQ